MYLWRVLHGPGPVSARSDTENWKGAALEDEAQVVEKLLALTLKAAKDLHKANGRALITFKSPHHLVLGLSPQEAIQDIGRGCSGL